MATVREPVPEFISSSTGTIFALNIFPYPFFNSSSTSNHIRYQYLPVPVFHFFPYENPYPYLSFSTMGNSSHYTFPYPFFISSRTRIPSRLYPLLISSSTGHHIRSQYLSIPVFFTVREDIESEYGFSYWKK